MSVRRTGHGAAFATMQAGLRDALRSSQNGPHENAKEKRDDSVLQWNCPTQATTGVEWAN